MAVVLELTKVFGSCLFTPPLGDFTCSITGTFRNHPPFTVVSSTVTGPTCTATISGGANCCTTPRVNFTITGSIDIVVSNATGATSTCTIPITFAGSALLPAPSATAFAACEVLTFDVTNITFEVTDTALVVHVNVATCALIKTVANINYLFPEEPAIAPTPTNCQNTLCPVTAPPATT